MASNVQRTDSGAIKITPDNKVQITCPDDLPLPALLCDSNSASGSKCGFDEFSGHESDPPKLYLNYDLTRAGSLTRSQGSGCPGSDFDESYATNVARNLSQHYDIEDDPCSLITDANTASSHNEITLDGVQGTTNDCPTDTTCWSPTTCGVCAGGDTSSDNTVTTGNMRTRTVIYAQSCENIFYCNPEHTDPATCDLGGSDVTTETLSGEYTTAMLISNAEDDLPGYSGYFGCEDDYGNPVTACDPETPVPPCFEDGQGCACSASYDLSDDEISLAIQEFKYKFVPDEDAIPSLDGWTLHWVERFIPDLTDDVIFEEVQYYAGAPDPDPDHWIDNARSFDWSDEEESPVYEVSHPDSNGEITIEDIFWC